MNSRVILFSFLIFLTFRSVHSKKSIFEINTHSTFTNAATTPKLNYYGGPVVSNVQVFTIWWGGSSNVNYSSQLEQFYSGVTNSSWYNVLSEYSTSTQSIATGKWVGSYSDISAPKGTFTDSQIQTRLTGLINNGSVPAVNANIYYAIHFQSGVSISSNGGSCQSGGFCAYHGTYSLNGKYVWCNSRSKRWLCNWMWK